MARKRNEEIRVHVVNYGEGRALMLRYKCPRTGKTFTRTSGTTSRKEANKEAGKWEAELREGRYKPASRITWQEFRERYESECVIPDMKESTAGGVSGIFDAVERILAPVLLSSIDGDAIERLKRNLREEHTTKQDGDKTVEVVTRREEETVRGHLRVIKAALRWAHKRKMLNEVPEIEITTAAGSKGRPITLEEFERILDAAPKVFFRIVPTKETDAAVIAKDKAQANAKAVPWKRLLWGLWWSGLRIGEALNLTWDDPRRPHVDLDGENSTITIPADCQKGGKETHGPIVPEFYTFLAQTPEAERTGLVFALPFRRKDTVSKVITGIGNAAGVKVGPSKCASAHDLRRSFGFRWAMRVMPVLLQKLMRHASIETSLKYYVGANTREESKLVWQAYRATESKEVTNQVTSADSRDRKHAKTS